MSSDWSGADLSIPMAIVIVAVLLTFVALAAIETSVAILVAIFALIFGGEVLEQFAAGLANGEQAEEEPDENPADALERLRTRYADGELSEAEFERRLEVLLETETVTDVERYLAQTDERTSERRRADLDRDRDLERSTD